MMGVNFKSMDGIFKNRLRDYSQIAPKDVWDNIEKSLNARKKAKRLLFYKIAASITALTILGSSYLYFSNQPMNLKNQVATIEKQDTKVTPLNEKKQNNEQEEVKLQSIRNKERRSAISKDETTSYEQNRKEFKENLIIPEQVDTKNLAEVRKVDVILQKLDQKEYTVLPTLMEGNIVDTRKQNIQSVLSTLPDVYNHSFAANHWDEENENKTSKWIIGGDFTPLYSYRNITDAGSDNSSDFYNSVEKPVMTYTGGLNLQYKAIDRLTIQAGVYYTTMGQSFDYMSVYANSAYDLVDAEYKDRFINTYSIENSTGAVSFNSQYVIVDNKSTRVENLSNNKAVADVSDPIYDKLGAEIQQNFQYVEVPFLMRYKLIDKDIDVNILGGLGANFLVGNDVFFKYAGNKEVVGKTEGVNTVNYNSTFGIGIEYPIVKSINIRLEPSIKYYLNEINSNSSVKSHPYSIGIYTGINYSF